MPRRPVGPVLAVAMAGAMLLAAAPTPPTPPRAAPPEVRELALAAAQRPPSPEPRPAEPIPSDRYALAGGCYTIEVPASGGSITAADGGLSATAPEAGAAEPFRLQATDLAHYLVIAHDGRLLAASEGAVGGLAGTVTGSSPGAAASGLTIGTTDRVAEEVATGPAGHASGRGAAVERAGDPRELADWAVEEHEDGFRLLLPALEAGLGIDGDRLVLVAPSEAATLRFVHTVGCHDWPEIEVNVEGPVVRGDRPYAETRGFLDAHLHGMAFEFLGGRARCGRPWHRYGVADALQGCKEHEASGGRTHVLEAFLSGRDPVRGHDTTGWPTFADWPAHDSLTYEQTYYRWIERAWRGGLRLYVNLLVDNNQLCKVYPFKRNSCNEMEGVRLQAQRLREFERYIDAQNGGPGRGWLRIVTDPFEARRVINQGKLAVVMGIEVSRLFDCGLVVDVPTCDRAQIDRQLAEVHALGVRQLELVNKFDNAFSGVAGDAGTTGILVNSANLMETGTFWRMAPCEEVHDHEHGHDPDEVHDRRQLNVGDDAGLADELVGRDALAGVILAAVGRTGAAPVYPPGPHCNTRGLSDLGRYLLEAMMDRGMIFDPDHMSARARHEALDLLESQGYSGVISSHSWADEVVYRRIYRLGGVVTPMAGSSTSFVDRWQRHREWADDRFLFGFGFGSDINGFATQGAPRRDGDVTYPFEGFGGVTIQQQRSGERVYDINVDGVAHYGLYPDWIEDLRRLAGDAIVTDLARGPEAYLQMWERALGVAPDSCRPDVPPLRDPELAALRRGVLPEEVLVTLGQPHTRAGSRFTYCLEGDRIATLEFDDDERLHRVTRSPAPRR